MNVAGQHELVETASVIVRALSDGRRRGCRIALADGPGPVTDLETVFFGSPIRYDIADRSLACALVLQASPSKELAAALPIQAMNGRERAALRLIEGRVALGWALGRWPGLVEPLHRWVGLPPLPSHGWTPARLLDRAVAVACERSAPPIPPILGELPLPYRAIGAVRANRSVLESRLPWSAASRRKRLSIFSVPITGPATAAADAATGHGVHDVETPAARDHIRTGVLYPEWNFVTGEYRDDYVAVLEQRLARRPSAAAPDRQLRTWFEQPLERRWVHRLEDGSDLDPDAIVDARCDDLARTPHQQRVYRDRLRSRRDVSCALLIDRSGSLAHELRFAFELACADALVGAMEAAGERHGVFSFWSDTRHRVVVELLRDFDDRHPCRPSTFGLKPGGYTRTGAAIRHVTARMRRQPGRRRALMILTDGIPCDEGYEGAYGYADVVKAVDEAGRAGVVVAIVAVGGPPGRELERRLPTVVHPVRELRRLPLVMASVHERLAAA